MRSGRPPLLPAGNASGVLAMSGHAGSRRNEGPEPRGPAPYYSTRAPAPCSDARRLLGPALPSGTGCHRCRSRESAQGYPRSTIRGRMRVHGSPFIFTMSKGTLRKVTVIAPRRH